MTAIEETTCILTDPKRKGAYCTIGGHGSTRVSHKAGGLQGEWAGAFTVAAFMGRTGKG